VGTALVIVQQIDASRSVPPVRACGLRADYRKVHAPDFVDGRDDVLELA